MQRDPLETFITSNREAFDDGIPALKVWADIDRRLEAPVIRRRRRWQHLRIAAAVAVLLTLGGVAGSYLTQSQANNPVAVLNEVAPEYSEMAKYYQEEIDRQVQLVSNSDQADPDVFQDLEQIDATMNELQQELLNAPRGTEQEIVENLIRSYQAKLAILQRVLDRINQTNDENSTINEVSI